MSKERIANTLIRTSQNAPKRKFFSITSREVRGIMATGVVIILLIITYEMHSIGNVGYALQWISCGEKPVVMSQQFAYKETPSQVTIDKTPGFFSQKSGSSGTVLSDTNYVSACSIDDALRYDKSWSGEEPKYVE